MLTTSFLGRMFHLDLSLCVFSFRESVSFFFFSFIPIVIVEVAHFHHLFAKGRERRQTKWACGEQGVQMGPIHLSYNCTNYIRKLGKTGRSTRRGEGAEEFDGSFSFNLSISPCIALRVLFFCLFTYLLLTLFYSSTHTHPPLLFCFKGLLALP